MLFLKQERIFLNQEAGACLQMQVRVYITMIYNKQ